MVTKCDEESRVLLCNVINRATRPKPTRPTDIEEASKATYVEICGFMGIRQKLAVYASVLNLHQKKCENLKKKFKTQKSFRIKKHRL